MQGRDDKSPEAKSRLRETKKLLQEAVSALTIGERNSGKRKGPPLSLYTHTHTHTHKHTLVIRAVRVHSGVCALVSTTHYMSSHY
jgi:hypothetical protein